MKLRWDESHGHSIDVELIPISEEDEKTIKKHTINSLCQNLEKELGNPVSSLLIRCRSREKDGMIQRWTKDIISPWERGFAVRETSMDFLHKHGSEVTGSVLNCGSGYDRWNYKRFFPNCNRYRLLDVESPREWYGRVEREIIVADVQNMPQVPTDSEDCIISYFFSYTLPSPESALIEYARILKPHGILLASFMADVSRAFKNLWSDKEAVEMVSKYFEVEDKMVHHEPGIPVSHPGWNRFIVGGQRLIMTFIKARLLNEIL